MNPDRAQVDSDSWPPGSGQNGRSAVCRANIRPLAARRTLGTVPARRTEATRLRGRAKFQPNRSVPALGTPITRRCAPDHIRS